MRIYEGTLLREARRRAGLSQADLAVALYRTGSCRGFVDRQQIHLWENTGRAPRPNTLATIAEILKVSMDCFFRTEPNAA